MERFSKHSIILFACIVIIALGNCKKEKTKSEKSDINNQNITENTLKNTESGDTVFSTNDELQAINPTFIKEENLDYNNIERRSYSIVVPSNSTDDQIKATIKKVTHEMYEKNPDIDGINIFVYLEGMDVEGTAYFKGVWCPNGVWGNISETTDRTDYKFNIIRVSEKPSEESYKEKFGLTADVRKQIYYDLIKAEDNAFFEAEEKYPYDSQKQAELRHQLEKKYDQKVLSKYGITKDIANSITSEGTHNNWPMPPLPGE